jgi:hypothetical protein
MRQGHCMFDFCSVYTYSRVLISDVIVSPTPADFIA